LGEVRYCKAGKADEPLAFVCGDVQGKVCPLLKVEYRF
jgi:hypothetical protein